MKVGIIGGGAWGFTLASHLAARHEVTLFIRNKELFDSLQVGIHPKFPHVTIPEMSIEMSFEKVGLMDYLIEASTVASIRSIVEELSKDVSIPLILSSKGIETTTGLVPIEIAKDAGWNGPLSVLSGPSLAHEMLEKKPTALIAASYSLPTSEEIASLFSSEHLFVATSFDPLGISIGGAYKNVIAIACGMIDTLYTSANTKAFILTKGFDEMVRYGIAKGASYEALNSVAGLGDLIATSLSPASRNYRFGSLYGQSGCVEKALETIGMVVEGMHTTKAIVETNRNDLLLPIAQMVYSIIYEKRSPKSAFEEVFRLHERDYHTISR